MSKGTKKPERHFGLSAEEVSELKAQYDQSKTLPNPHRDGAYRFTIDALLALGSNQAHPVAKAHEEFKRTAGGEWYKNWASKKSDLDAHARFLQNVRVLQRTGDYGRKLLEVGQRVLATKGCVIDLTRDDKGELLVSLNTDSAMPQKPGRAPKVVTVASKPQKPQAKPKAKRKSKARKKAAQKPRKASQKKAAQAK